jgi:hypothetical protein
MPSPDRLTPAWRGRRLDANGLRLCRQPQATPPTRKISMALKLSSLKSSVSDEGEWVDIPEWPGVRLKVRSIAVKDYQIARDLLLSRLSRRLGRMPTGPEMEPDLGRLVAIHLLRGWEGLAGADDKAEQFTPERAIQLLTDPDLRQLETQVIWAASHVGETELEFTEDAEKN